MIAWVRLLPRGLGAEKRRYVDMYVDTQSDSSHEDEPRRCRNPPRVAIKNIPPL